MSKLFSALVSGKGKEQRIGKFGTNGPLCFHEENMMLLHKNRIDGGRRLLTTDSLFQLCWV